MALAWLARIQLLCAAGVLLWLAAALGFAARDGFLPTRERYVPQPASGAGAVQILRQALPPQGRRVITALGRAADVDGETAPVEKALARLAEQGVEVRRCELDTLYTAADQAHVLCVVEDRPEFRDLDWTRLAGVLAQPVVADFTSMLPGDSSDAAGIEILNFGRPMWPAWLDPEYLQFAAYMRSVIPDDVAADARIMLVAGQPYRTAATRSRWFLMLNYELAPRRFYLWNPVEASGYVMQYFAWVDQMNQPERWDGARYLHMNDRALSKISRSTSAPTRGLTPDELAAAEAIGAEWILLQTPNVDFRLVDWELLPLERVRGWSEAPR